MTHRRTFYRLDRDFVAAVRQRFEDDWPTVNSLAGMRKLPWHGFEQIYHGCPVVVQKGTRTSRRLERLAEAIGYAGPIFGEELSS